MKQYDRAHIINAIKKGNRKVFEEVFTYFYPKLIRITAKYICECDEREDIVQETFLFLWENIERLKIVSLEAYLYTTVRNKCLNSLKKRRIKDENQIFLLESYLDTYKDGSNVDGSLKRILELLLTLPESMRHIFECKYLNGLTAAEIAAEMNISTNTVNTQLKRAKIRIKRVLDKAQLLFLSFL